MASYGSSYGLLWFCNVGLILITIGLWSENRLLISMVAVGNVPWLLLWCVHVVVRLVGLMFQSGAIDGPASYMFNSDYPLYARILSVYHCWLPFVVLFVLYKIGYDTRAIIYQTLLAWILIIAAYLTVPDANTPAGNVNMVFGYTVDRDPVLWTSRPVWIAILMVCCPALLYLPAHLFYRRFFLNRSAAAIRDL